jgi:hypothetical protein
MRSRPRSYRSHSCSGAEISGERARHRDAPPQLPRALISR